jgi:hypothetical protein
MTLIPGYRAPTAFLSAWLFSGALLLIGVGARAAEDRGPDRPAEDAPPPERERPAHPEPRVIVNVLSVRGAHRQAEIERSARFGWSRIVRCYKSNDPRQQAIVNMELVVTGAGTVASARRVHSLPKHRELASCLAQAMRRLTMPKARTDSIASIEIRVAPGDPPAKSEGRARSPD